MAAYSSALGARTRLLPTSSCIDSPLLHLLLTHQKTASSLKILPRSNYDQQASLTLPVPFSRYIPYTSSLSFALSSIFCPALLSLFSHVRSDSRFPPFGPLRCSLSARACCIFSPVIAQPRNGVSGLVNGFFSCQQSSPSKQHPT